MKAITYAQYGGPDVLRVSEVDKPVPGDSDLLIRVHAAEATKADCEMRSFKFPVKWFWLPLRLAIGVRRPRRQMLGVYFAGEVDAVGPAVSRFVPGAKVYGAVGLKAGAYGEYVTVKETGVVSEKPSNMTFAEAAAVPLGGMNALHFMSKADISPGEDVLIIGAGGSIGAHAVQIARSMGANVSAVDHHRKEAFVRGLGAGSFVDYTSSNVTASGDTWDVIFDMVPRTSYSKLLSMLRPGGRYVNGNPTLPVLLRSVGTNRFSEHKVIVALAEEAAPLLGSLREMVEAGKIRSIVDRVYPMDEAAEAHRRVETEERLGAVVIDIGDSERR